MIARQEASRGNDSGELYIKISIEEVRIGFTIIIVNVRSADLVDFLRMKEETGTKK